MSWADIFPIYSLHWLYVRLHQVASAPTGSLVTNAMEGNETGLSDNILFLSGWNEENHEETSEV
jgi:hypothetical protein